MLLCVCAGISVYAGLPSAPDCSLVNRAPHRDMVKQDFRIALAQLNCYDWENWDGNEDDYFTEVYAPCFNVNEWDDAVCVLDFYNGLTLPIFTEGDGNGNTIASIPYCYVLLNDSVIGTARNRVDTVRLGVVMSWSYFMNDEDCDIMGTVNDDGSVVLSGDSENYGFMFYQEVILRTYRNRQLTQCDTLVSLSPVFAYMELLNPNGVHDYTRVFYSGITNPLTPDDIDPVVPDDPTPDTPEDTTQSTPSIPGGHHKPTGSARLRTDYGMSPLGVGSSGRPIKPKPGQPWNPSGFVVMGDDTPTDGYLSTLDDLRGSSLSSVSNPNDSTCLNVTKRINVSGLKVYEKDLYGLLGVFPNGRPIKPTKPGNSPKPVDGNHFIRPNDNGGSGVTITSAGQPNDSTGSTNGLGIGRSWKYITAKQMKSLTGPTMEPLGVGPGKKGPIRPSSGGDGNDVLMASGYNSIHCTSEVVIRPVGNNEIMVCNMYGSGQVNYIILNEDSTMSLPKQVIGNDRVTGENLYNYYAPTADINVLTPGNSGWWTAGAVNWGTTIPSADLGESQSFNLVVDSDHWNWGREDDLLPYVATLPFFYRNNSLTFTDGQQFGLDEVQMLRTKATINDVEKVINGMIDGDRTYSIDDVSRMIDEMLGNQ